MGDEDLLEIIGNGRDPVLITRHLTKMFAGIAALKLEVASTPSGASSGASAPVAEGAAAPALAVAHKHILGSSFVILRSSCITNSRSLLSSLVL